MPGSVGLETEFLAGGFGSILHQLGGGNRSHPLQGIDAQPYATFFAQTPGAFEDAPLDLGPDPFVYVSQIKGKFYPSRDYVDPARRQVQLPDRPDGGAGPRGFRLYSPYDMGSSGQRITPEPHRRRARVSRLAFQGDPEPQRPGYARDDPNGPVLVLEEPSLPDV